MGNMIKIASVMVMTALLISGNSFTSNGETDPDHAQMMEISCQSCHKNINVDISQSHAECTHCGCINHFDG
ncbi:hypothetical protein [Butyrivibrio sp. FC2001]|uniref:hypothetical protein n=1 Tax=Butyrivibrio sp. FC2001 TaxID=1280671 RepID=UPI0003F81BEC|nr:hypothetical protein [Butyrivibrio sp. FC2001]